MTGVQTCALPILPNNVSKMVNNLYSKGTLNKFTENLLTLYISGYKNTNTSDNKRSNEVVPKQDTTSDIDLMMSAILDIKEAVAELKESQPSTIDFSKLGNLITNAPPNILQTVQSEQSIQPEQVKDTPKIKPPEPMKRSAGAGNMKNLSKLKKMKGGS